MLDFISPGCISSCTCSSYCFMTFLRLCQHPLPKFPFYHGGHGEICLPFFMEGRCLKCKRTRSRVNQIQEQLCCWRTTPKLSRLISYSPCVVIPRPAVKTA